MLYSSYGELEMPYNIDETLKSSDLPSDLKPHLLWREVLLGAEKRKIFMQLVEETEELVGNVGTKSQFPMLVLALLLAQ